MREEEAIREGFADTYWGLPWAQFCETWQELHGPQASYATCDVWRIEFTDPRPAQEAA